MILSRKAGSIGHLWYIASFLMLSSLSAMAMMFVDRLMLAKFSLEAHNAAVEAANLGWAFQAFWTSLAGISHIFVSQYNGARQTHLLSKPAWQIIWFSIAAFALFIPLAIWSPNFLYDNEIKRSYLFWMVLFVPFHGIFVALNGFFIGQNLTSITVKVVILGNVLNLVFDYILIFGIENYIPSFGATGAIVASNIALLIQIMVLFRYFWKSSHKNQIKREIHYKFDFSLLSRCIKVAFPNALFGILEALGWSLFYSMMSVLSDTHLTVAGIVQNVLILAFFFADGLSRAVSTLTGNAIGAQRPEIIPRILRSAITLMTIFCGLLGLILWSLRAPISNWFLSDLSLADQDLIYPALLFGLVNAVIYKYLEGIRMTISGILTAVADTKFLLISGSISIWVFMVMPVYFFVLKTQGSVEFALALCSIYTLITALIFIWRFYKGNWMANANIILN